MADSSAPGDGAVNESNQDGNDTGDKTSSAGDEFKPITTQDDLNKVVADRVSRERAKYSDYKDVKAKAAKFDELEEKNKSEQQKLLDKLTEAEKTAQTAQLNALRFKYASRHQIGDDDAELFLTGTDEETIAKQAERFAQSQSDRKKKTNYVPGEGNPASAPTSDGKREFLRSVTKRE